MKLGIEKYTAQLLSPTPPFECGLKVGDVIEWENYYGAVWTHRIIGFSDPCSVGFFHMDTDAYWFPHPLSDVRKINGIPVESR